MTSAAITRGAATTTATVQITQTTWVVHLKGRLVAVVKLTTRIATASAKTRSAFGMLAIAQHPIRPPKGGYRRIMRSRVALARQARLLRTMPKMLTNSNSSTKMTN